MPKPFRGNFDDARPGSMRLRRSSGSDTSHPRPRAISTDDTALPSSPVLATMDAFLKAPVGSPERHECLEAFLTAAAAAKQRCAPDIGSSVGQMRLLPLMSLVKSLARTLQSGDIGATKRFIREVEAFGLHFLCYWFPQSDQSEEATRFSAEEANFLRDTLKADDDSDDDSERGLDDWDDEGPSLSDLFLNDPAPPPSQEPPAPAMLRHMLNGGQDRDPTLDRAATLCRQCLWLHKALDGEGSAAHMEKHVNVCAEVETYCCGHYPAEEAQQHIARVCYWLGTRHRFIVLTIGLKQLIDVFSMSYVAEPWLEAYLKLAYHQSLQLTHKSVPHFPKHSSLRTSSAAASFWGFLPFKVSPQRDLERLRQILVEVFGDFCQSEVLNPEHDLVYIFSPARQDRFARVLFMLLKDVSATDFYKPAREIVIAYAREYARHVDDCQQQPCMTTLLQRLIEAAETRRAQLQPKLLFGNLLPKEKAEREHKLDLLARFLSAAKVLHALTEPRLNFTWTAEDYEHLDAMQQVLRDMLNPPAKAQQAGEDPAQARSARRKATQPSWWSKFWQWFFHLIAACVRVWSRWFRGVPEETATRNPSRREVIHKVPGPVQQSVQKVSACPLGSAAKNTLLESPRPLS